MRDIRGLPREREQRARGSACARVCTWVASRFSSSSAIAARMLSASRLALETSASASVRARWAPCTRREVPTEKSDESQRERVKQ